MDINNLRTRQNKRSFRRQPIQSRVSWITTSWSIDRVLPRFQGIFQGKKKKKKILWYLERTCSLPNESEDDWARDPPDPRCVHSRDRKRLTLKKKDWIFTMPPFSVFTRSPLPCSQTSNLFLRKEPFPQILLPSTSQLHVQIHVHIANCQW